MNDISRREFLIGAGALAFLAACGKTPRLTKPASISDLIANARKRGAVLDLNIFPGGDDYVSKVDNYVALGLVTNEAIIVGSTATVWGFSGADGTGTPMGPLTAPYYAYAKPEPGPTTPKGVNAVEMKFLVAGPWRFYVEVEIDGKIHANSTTFAVAQASPSPLPGQKAIASATPTTANHRGVDPICTRTPICPFHRVSLADALKENKPVIFYVGTPALCQSRTCGPNLEELITASKQLGDRVAIVHSEVYRELSQDAVNRQLFTPTFARWGFGGEPWVYVIEPGGTIASRAQGPMTSGQILSAAGSLLT